MNAKCNLELFKLLSEDELLEYSGGESNQRIIWVFEKNKWKKEVVYNLMCISSEYSPELNQSFE